MDTKRHKNDFRNKNLSFYVNNLMFYSSSKCNNFVFLLIFHMTNQNKINFAHFYFQFKFGICEKENEEEDTQKTLGRFPSEKLFLSFCLFLNLSL
jgi:hypothetical protein